MIKKALLIVASAIAGIYLTSEDGKSARLTLQKKNSKLKPIIKELLEEASKILDGSESVNSDKLKANVEKIVDEVKFSLINLDLEKATDTIKEAIQVASRKLRDASNEVEKEKRAKAKKTAAKK